MPPENQNNNYQQNPYDEKFIVEEEEDPVFLAILLSFALPIVGFWMATRQVMQASSQGREARDAKIAVRISIIMFFVWLLPLGYVSYKVIQGFDPPEVVIDDVNTVVDPDPDPVKIVVPSNIDDKLAWEYLVTTTDYRANDILIYYKPDESVLIDPALAARHLDGIADYASKYPDQQFVITGFTNTDRITDFTQQLSIDRSQRAVDELVSRGVDVGRIQSSGEGSFELYFGYASSEEANRTVTITLAELAPDNGR